MAERTRPSWPLRVSRAAGVVAGVGLIVGETARRWHQFGEPAMWPRIFDDYLVGLLLLVGAWGVFRWRCGRAALAAAWGFALGVGSSSVTAHALALDEPDPSGIDHALVFGVLLGMWVAGAGMLALTLRAPACRDDR